MPRPQIAFATIAVAVALSAGCGPKSPNDQSIITDIQSKLYADALTKPAGVAVAVQSGVVTLSGDVPSSDVALEAMKIANGTSGVRGVNDKMTINGSSAEAQLPNAGNPTASNSTPATASSAPASPPPAQTPPPSQVAQSAPPPSEPAPEPVTITIPAGTALSVRTIDVIDSKNSTPGQTFSASLNAPLTHGNRVIIPVGAPVTLVLAQAKSAGRIKGSSELEVRVTGIEYRGRNYPVDSSVYAEQGKGRGKQTGVRTGIGAAAGALIGGLAGGGKGAGIGAAVGGGAGFGSAALTHGQQVKIPSETVLTFRLEAPLRIRR